MMPSQSKEKMFISIKQAKVKTCVTEWARGIDVLNRILGET